MYSIVNRRIIMPAGPTQGHGDLNPITAPAHFPASLDSLVKKTVPTQVIYNTATAGVQGSDAFTDDFEVGGCEGFTVYVNGTGDWNVQAAPNNNHNESFWTDLISSDETGDGFYSTNNYHHHVRVKIKSGANLIVWLYRKFASY